MLLDLKFWRQKRTRPNNPTYSSKLVSSTLPNQYPDKDRYNAKNQTPQIKRSFSSLEFNKSNQQIIHHPKNQQSNVSPLYVALPKLQSNHLNTNAVQRDGKCTTSSVQAAMTEPITRKESIRSLSRIQTLGKSNSVNQSLLPDKIKKNLNQMEKEINLFFSSSKQVFQKQQKNYDIIKNSPKQYKSSINLFPKFRLERLDKEFKTRQAFLKGDMEMIKKLRNQNSLNINSKLSNNAKNNQTSQFMINSKDTAFRRNLWDWDNEKPMRYSNKKLQPIDTAFKITENPEIINKKLVMQK